MKKSDMVSEKRASTASRVQRLLSALLVTTFVAGSGLASASEHNQLAGHAASAPRNPRLPNINLYVSRSEIKKLLGKFISAFAQFERWAAWLPAAVVVGP